MTKTLADLRNVRKVLADLPVKFLRSDSEIFRTSKVHNVAFKRVLFIILLNYPFEKKHQRVAALLMGMD